MTSERTMYTTDRFLDPYRFDLTRICWHLLKFREIVDASTQKLPRLQSIEVELHTYSWDMVLLTRIKATNEGGVLWVNWNDVQIGFNHPFEGFNGCGRPEVNDYIAPKKAGRAGGVIKRVRNCCCF
jgi:hypothetical protein